MLIPDVNVLVAAMRPDHEHHDVAASWLAVSLAARQGIGLTMPVMTAAVRVLTNSRVFNQPDSPEVVVAGIDALLARRRVEIVPSTRRCWPIFARLCEAVTARGDLVTDAWHAAAAIEHGATLVSFDKGFARFPGLSWLNPLEA